jgi:hypothetical protein
MSAIRTEQAQMTDNHFEEVPVASEVAQGATWKERSRGNYLDTPSDDFSMRRNHQGNHLSQYNSKNYKQITRSSRLLPYGDEYYSH